MSPRFLWLFAAVQGLLRSSVSTLTDHAPSEAAVLARVAPLQGASFTSRPVWPAGTSVALMLLEEALREKGVDPHPTVGVESCGGRNGLRVLGGVSPRPRA